MSTDTISHFTDLYDICLEQFRRSRYLFRGVSDFHHELIPKVGREPRLLGDERKLIEHFAREAPAYDDVIPDSPWELLAVAQHFGLSTRLLDWTENALVAVFFACSGNPEVDGAFYVLDCPRVVKDSSKRLDSSEIIESPFDIPTVCRYRPRMVTKRILAQRGQFSVHPQPGEPLCVGKNEGTEVWKFKIPSASKLRLLDDVSRFDVHYASLFPDLNGLARNINDIYRRERL